MELSATMMTPSADCGVGHRAASVKESLNSKRPKVGFSAGFGVAVACDSIAIVAVGGNQTIVGVLVISGVAVNNSLRDGCSCETQPARLQAIALARTSSKQILIGYFFN